VKIVALLRPECPRAFSEAFRFAATVAGFQGQVYSSPEEFQAQSRTLSATEELHYLFCTLDDREFAQALLSERGFVHSVATTHKATLGDPEKRALQSGFARHVLPFFDRPGSDQDLRERLLSTFWRWKIPQFKTLEHELPYARVQRMQVHNSHQKDLVSQSVEEFLSQFAGLTSPRFKATFLPRALEVTDELVQNAVAISCINQDSNFSLQAEEAIDVTFGFDGGNFGVSVSDARGALLPWTFFRKALGHTGDTPSFENSRGPSLGLGLRSSLALSHSLTAQVAVGRFCCVTALVPYLRTTADFDASPKRVEYFGL
jgi:hypothetical protein